MEKWSDVALNAWITPSSGQRGWVGAIIQVLCYYPSGFPTSRHACKLSRFHRVWLFGTLWTCSPPGSSVRGFLQARILEWVVMPFSIPTSLQLSKHFFPSWRGGMQKLPFYTCSLDYLKNIFVVCKASFWFHPLQMLRKQLLWMLQNFTVPSFSPFSVQFMPFLSELNVDSYGPLFHMCKFFVNSKFY